MSKRRLGIIIILALIIGAGLYYFSLQKQEQSPEQQQNAQEIPEVKPVDENKPKTYLTLTGNEYKQLFLDSSHPNTKDIVEPPVITGDKALDARIVSLALARGYLLQEVPNSDLLDYDGHLLQQKLADSWKTLKDQAAKAGINLKITSGLRTVDDQRQLFIERLGSATSDAQINNVLAMTAPPGYSRHHSGYVIDIADESASVFEYSAGYKWLSADNYLVPKKLGIIPSYPDGAKNQGPEPEPWEYVWVGEQLLIE